MSCCRGGSRLPSPYQQRFNTVCSNCRRDNVQLIQQEAARLAASVRKTTMLAVPITCPCGTATTVQVQVRRA